MKSLMYIILDNLQHQQQLLKYFENKKNIIFLNSNQTGKTNFIAVSDSNNYEKGSLKFGFIGYDYKNQIEELTSSHFDGIDFPEKHFFTPELLFKIKEQEVEVCYNKNDYSENKLNEMLEEIQAIKIGKRSNSIINVKPRVEKEAYIKNVEALKKHIKQGDIYEVNYCQEFYAEQTEIDPIELYFMLNEKSPTPFSCFVKYEDKYLLSASPERFIKKDEDSIISQPIKGTIRRGTSKYEDDKLKNELLNDEKERSENIMIVDLVRNDLSKIAQKDSVKVDELCGIYTYPQVHQMISTVKAQLSSKTNFDAILKATFPMGSMTGAPKISAMKLIEKYEATKRGLYAGTVGYIDENNDFDFNVVIRSIQFNKINKYLSFIVGGAITDKSVPEKEYQECMLKAKAIFEVLNGE
jgi:para-aminobenzoate synthetase component 1